MPIHILPIITTISNLASTTWEIYRKASSVTEDKRHHRAQEVIDKRADKLEDCALEQARLISELSKELEQFAQAVEADIEAAQARETRLRRIAYASLTLAIAGIGIALAALIK